jgi:hypothetical protein
MVRVRERDANAWQTSFLEALEAARDEARA